MAVSAVRMIYVTCDRCGANRGPFGSAKIGRTVLQVREGWQRDGTTDLCASCAKELKVAS